MNNAHILIKETRIDRPLKEVFEFFSDAGNLEKLTPDFLNFKIVTPMPIEMHQGALIDYQIKLFGIPFKWKTKITAWEPGHRFVDEQLSGPYSIWIHEHLFEEVADGTLMTDTIKYRSLNNILDFIPHQLFVKKKVEEIFEYREIALRQLFG